MYERLALHRLSHVSLAVQQQQFIRLTNLLDEDLGALSQPEFSRINAAEWRLTTALYLEQLQGITLLSEAKGA